MAGKTAVKTDVKAGRFRQKVLSFMKKNHMTDRGDSVLAAVSGGADSVCLLLILHEMAAELGIKVFAFHMNHGIRGAEADRDEQFVMELCERLNILPHRPDPGKSGKSASPEQVQKHRLRIIIFMMCDSDLRALILFRSLSQMMISQDPPCFFAR